MFHLIPNNFTHQIIKSKYSVSVNASLFCCQLSKFIIFCQKIITFTFTFAQSYQQNQYVSVIFINMRISLSKLKIEIYKLIWKEVWKSTELSMTRELSEKFTLKPRNFNLNEFYMLSAFACASRIKSMCKIEIWLKFKGNYLVRSCVEMAEGDLGVRKSSICIIKLSLIIPCHAMGRWKMMTDIKIFVNCYTVHIWYCDWP